MAGAGLFANFSGFEQLDANVKKLQTMNYDAALRGAAEVLRQIVGEAFKNQADPESGQAWKPTGSLALSTRPGGGTGGKTLVDTGRLMQSLMASVPYFTATETGIGTNLVYASTQQAGAKITRSEGDGFLYIPLTREAKRAASAKRWIEQNKDKKLVWIGGKKSEVGFLAYIDETPVGPNEKGKKLIKVFLRKKSVVIPARPFLGMNETHQDKIVGIIQFQLGRTWTEQDLRDAPAK